MNATATPTTKEQLRTAMKFLKGFIGPAQFRFIAELARGEEGQWFMDRMVELHQQIEAMPKTFENRDNGDQTIAHLHYFIGRCDVYITEKDVDTDGEGQVQAYGSCNVGYGPELGYVSIPEITAAGAEIDLHFKPKTLASLKAWPYSANNE